MPAALLRGGLSILTLARILVGLMRGQCRPNCLFHWIALTLQNRCCAYTWHCVPSCNHHHRHLRAGPASGAHGRSDVAWPQPSSTVLAARRSTPSASQLQLYFATGGHPPSTAQSSIPSAGNSVTCCVTIEAPRRIR